MNKINLSQGIYLFIGIYKKIYLCISLYVGALVARLTEAFSAGFKI